MEAVKAFAPGRTELAGNHTDHQGGRVIAAAVDCGIEVVMRPNDTHVARVASEGFDPVELDVRDMAARSDERGTTAALVRGVIAGMRALGEEVRGFDAEVSSTIPSGSGLSSSAAFELALATAILQASDSTERDSPLRPKSNEANFDRRGLSLSVGIELAKVGQAAERDFFGKPCGLMDQLAVALGGIAAIDFAGGDEPAVERIDYDFASSGYALCLIDTHCDHSLYTEEYAQVAFDMADVAELLGEGTLSQVPEKDFLGRLGEVRAALGDLPALRALHYYLENRLVDARAHALRAGDFEAFLDFTRRSAMSSAAYLQNVSTVDRRSQPAMVALALAETLLAGKGACRIHGGGFGGTVQAFVPQEEVDAFSRGVDAHLGAGSCKVYRVGGKGAHAECLR